MKKTIKCLEYLKNISRNVDDFTSKGAMDFP